MDDLLPRWAAAHRPAFVAALLGAIFVYGMPLSHFALHIDDEVATLGAAGQLVSLGRWATAAIHLALPANPVIPFFAPALCVLLMAASAAAAAAILGVPPRQATVFALLYVAFPQFAYQMEFQHQSFPVALGILCAILAHGVARTGQPARIAAAAALLALAIAFYQAIAVVFATTVILSCLRSRAHGASAGSGWAEPATGAGVLALACIGHAASTAAIRAATGNAPASGYLLQQVGWLRGSGLHATLGAAFGAGRTVARGMVGAGYAGHALYATVWIPVVAIVAGAARGARAGTAAWALAAVAAPFALVIVLGQEQAPRTLVATPLAFAGLWTLGLGRVAGWRTPPVVAVAASLLFGCFVVSRLFQADAAAWDADRLLGNRIVDALYRVNPGLDVRATPVLFTGSTAPPNIWKVRGGNTFGASFFAWDGGNPARIVAFLRASGIAELTAATGPEAERVATVASALPAWPDPRSVALVGGVMVVKLGPVAGAHSE